VEALCIWNSFEYFESLKEKLNKNSFLISFLIQTK